MTAEIIGKKVVLPELSVVEGERQVDKIEFILPSSYGQTEFKGMSAYVNIRRADGTTDKIPMEMVEQENGIKAEWQIDASATAVPGELGGHVSIENGEGTVVFMTERFTLCIAPSVNAYRDYTDRTPNAIHKLQLDMLAYVDRMQELVDEFEQKLNDAEVGGGGEVYDEQNKLPVAYVDGLATVAKSGSYSDLTEKPDMSLYVSKAEFAQVQDLFINASQPIYINYISYSLTTGQIIAGCQENKNIIKEWLSYGMFVRPIFLRDSETNMHYPLYYIFYESGNQIDFYFKRETGLYTASYNISNDTYGFSE